MTTASAHCSRPLRFGTLRALLRAGGVALGIALALPAAAHKSSDAYLMLDARGPSPTLRVDVALRDLDAALDIDTDGDAKLTWAEVRAAWPAIETYALQRVDVIGCKATAQARALEQRADGAYAALRFGLDCSLAGAPQVRYRVLREIDPTHRGLLRVQLPGQAPLLRVLDPTLDLPDAPTGLAAVATSPRSAVLPSAANDAGTATEVATAGQTRGAQASLTGAVPPNPMAQADLGAAAGAAGAAPSTNPGAASSAGFVSEGVHHIVTGWDHVLFLLCLLLPSVMVRTPGGWRPVERLRNAVWPVAGIVTAFTLAHSITLTLAALKIVSLSPSFIEPAIAATIVLAAADNVRPIFFGHRGWVTFAFGLIHGFGFAGVLAELELPAAQFVWALFQFNLGLELGQLAIVVIATGLLFAVRGRSGYPAWAIRGGSFAMMATGVLWLIERIGDVSLLAL